MKTLIAFLLMASLAYGAQPKDITVPVGETPIGPISVNALHRFAKFDGGTITLAPGQTIRGRFEYSTDKGATWRYLCGFKSEIPIPIAKPFYRGCPFPEGTTHIQGVVTVTGAPVVLTLQPTLSSQ